MFRAAWVIVIPGFLPRDISEIIIVGLCLGLSFGAHARAQDFTHIDHTSSGRSSNDVANVKQHIVVLRQAGK